MLFCSLKSVRNGYNFFCRFGSPFLGRSLHPFNGLLLGPHSCQFKLLRPDYIPGSQRRNVIFRTCRCSNLGKGSWRSSYLSDAHWVDASLGSTWILHVAPFSHSARMSETYRQTDDRQTSWCQFPPFACMQNAVIGIMMFFFYSCLPYM